MARRRQTTTMSTKGQVIIPKEVRARIGWRPGTRLVVEETKKGLLLEPAEALAPTRPEEVFGCLKYTGRPKTVEEMSEAVTAEVRKRRDRGRY